MAGSTRDFGAGGTAGAGDDSLGSAAVARRSLRPQLNQIRTWVRQGRTDAWIAHQLEVTVKDIDQFKREHGLAPDDGESLEERDLRAEDDELVAAELDALDAEAEDEEPDEDEPEPTEDAETGDGETGDGGEERPRSRRRGRRGGRRRRGARALEGTFDHGEEGYGLWLDPAIQDDGVYAEHWAGHRPVVVTVEPDRIVITRAGERADEPAESAADAG